MIFPHPLTAEPDGLLAYGGTLEPETLIFAYENGIFPWYSEPPILWWFTHPRSVLFPHEIKISKSMRSLIKKKRFRATCNTQFERVIHLCASSSREGQNSTWISIEIENAYTRLHYLNYAHSVEVWEGENLVGGLYGVIVGKIFFGESMFNKSPNASKFALITLTAELHKNGFHLVDCQQDTPHMRTLGAHLISGESFWSIICKNRLEDPIFNLAANWGGND